MSENASQKYIYCLVNSNTPDLASLRGLGSGGLELITHNDISAIVSCWDQGDVPASDENLKIHNQVLETLLETSTTVVPFEFGTVAPSPEDISKMLKRNYLLIAKTIKTLHHRTEVNIKALWLEVKNVLEAIVKENRAITRLKEEIASASFESTYKKRIVIGQMIAERLDAKREQLATKILGALKKHSPKTHLRTPSTDSMIFNASFLLEREKLKSFDETLEALAKQHGDIDFKYIGPLPPYSFIDVKLKI